MKRMLMFAASVAALMAIAEPAQSREGWTIVTNGSNGNSVTTIVPHVGGSIARIIHLPQTSDYGAEGFEDWDIRCQPRRYLQPSTGLWRVYFAHENCGGDTAARQ